MSKKLISFGYKNGVPADDGIIIDVRPIFTRNPYHEHRLRKLTGLHAAVQNHITRMRDFDLRYAQLKERILATPAETIYLGCTGGLHRSVYLAQRLSEELFIPAIHRDIPNR
jgi:UPF0042 nucleotide-binding protein